MSDTTTIEVDYKAKANAAIRDYSATGITKVYPLNSQQWHELASYWLLIRAGVVLSVPSSFAAKLRSDPMRDEAEAVARRWNFTIEQALNHVEVSEDSRKCWERETAFHKGTTAKEIFSSPSLWKPTKRGSK